MNRVIEIEDEEEDSASPAKPMEGLGELGPPPFLTKTFEMVEDPSTDLIVSWTRARNSFVVWDYAQFSTLLLPRYFKHGNFSSFIRQLNTYGFRKVDPDRWEFANEGFLGGQRHLLKTIKRRRNVSQSLNQNPYIEVGEFGIESEVERLKRDRGVLMSEIVRLRQNQVESEEKVSAMEARLESSEKKHRNMMGFLARALTNPEFVLKLNRRNARKGVIKESGRKRSLAAGPSSSRDDPLPGNSSLGDSLVDEALWEELFGDDDDNKQEVDLAGEIEDLVGDNDDEQDLNELVDEMGFLGP